MTWQSARAAAREKAAALLGMVAAAEASGAHVDLLPLSEYTSAADYAACKDAGETWTFEFHRMVTRAVARELKRHGLEVVLVEISASEFLPWLRFYGLENAPEFRSQFLNLKLAGALYKTPPILPPSS